MHGLYRWLNRTKQQPCIESYPHARDLLIKEIYFQKAQLAVERRDGLMSG